MNRRMLLPLGIFVVLAGFLFAGLWRDPREVPSPLIDKPAPAFALNELHLPQQKLGTADMKGQVWLMNVWASWCVSCRQEHPVLVDYAKSHGITVVGLDYKDQREDGMRWLRQFGNPYVLSAFDADGRVGIDYGVYGVPETYVIDKQGIIRYKQIGPITRETLEKTIYPLVEKLKKS